MLLRSVSYICELENLGLQPGEYVTENKNSSTVAKLTKNTSFRLRLTTHLLPAKDNPHFGGLDDL